VVGRQNAVIADTLPMLGVNGKTTFFSNITGTQKWPCSALQHAFCLFRHWLIVSCGTPQYCHSVHVLTRNWLTRLYRAANFDYFDNRLIDRGGATRGLGGGEGARAPCRVAVPPAGEFWQFSAGNARWAWKGRRNKKFTSLRRLRLLIPITF